MDVYETVTEVAAAPQRAHFSAEWVFGSVFASITSALWCSASAQRAQFNMSDDFCRQEQAGYNKHSTVLSTVWWVHEDWPGVCRATGAPSMSESCGNVIASSSLISRYVQAGTGLSADDEPRFLVTGARGQIGAELIPMLRERHPGAVIASDVRMSREALDAGPFVYCDVQVPWRLSSPGPVAFPTRVCVSVVQEGMRPYTSLLCPLDSN